MPLESPETNEETKLAIIKENHERSAAEILDCYQNAQRLAADAKADAQLAIKAALKCGAMCNAKKTELKDELGHGHWLKWHERFLPEIDLGTVERWMRMAKSCHDTILNSQPKSLRQAYIAVGILPDPMEAQRKRLSGQSKPLKPTSGNLSLLTIINEFRAQKPVEALVQTQDFSSWDVVELETISNRLAPIVAAHRWIVVALQRKLMPNGGVMFPKDDL